MYPLVVVVVVVVVKIQFIFHNHFVGFVVAHARKVKVHILRSWPSVIIPHNIVETLVWFCSMVKSCLMSEQIKILRLGEIQDFLPRLR